MEQLPKEATCTGPALLVRNCGTLTGQSVSKHTSRGYVEIMKQFIFVVYKRVSCTRTLIFFLFSQTVDEYVLFVLARWNLLIDTSYHWTLVYHNERGCIRYREFPEPRLASFFQTYRGVNVVREVGVTSGVRRGSIRSCL